jgi:hypothetical protein
MPWRAACLCGQSCACPGARHTINNATVIHGNIRACAFSVHRGPSNNALQFAGSQARLRFWYDLPACPVWINCAHALEQRPTINNATHSNDGNNICGACASVSQGPVTSLHCFARVLTGRLRPCKMPLATACLCGSILRMPWSKTGHKLVYTATFCAACAFSVHRGAQVTPLQG